MIDPGLKRITERLTQSLERDLLVQQTTSELRNLLQVDRVVLYYFYRQWNGQVTYEALSQQQFSILGCSGPDECFNGDYAALYETGRSRAIADIESESIADCHRDFLRNLQVRANLVVPILNPQGLWGLLIAHHCQSPKQWVDTEMKAMKTAATALEKVAVIQES